MIISGHHCAHAMTTEVSSHVQIGDLIGSIGLELEQKYFLNISVMIS